MRFASIPLCSLVLIACGTPLAAQDDPWGTTRSLSGLKSVQVVVSEFRDEGAANLKRHLPEARLKVAIELELRRNGITVDDENSVAALRMVVSARDALPNGDLLVASITLGLYQWVRTLGGQRIYAPTWQRVGYAWGGASETGETLANLARQMVEDFANDYLKANPRAAERL